MEDGVGEVSRTIFYIGGIAENNTEASALVDLTKSGAPMEWLVAALPVLQRKRIRRRDAICSGQGAVESRANLVLVTVDERSARCIVRGNCIPGGRGSTASWRARSWVFVKEWAYLVPGVWPGGKANQGITCVDMVTYVR